MPRLLLAATLVAQAGALTVCGVSGGLDRAAPPSACGGAGAGDAAASAPPRADAAPPDGDDELSPLVGLDDSSPVSLRGTVIEDPSDHALDAFYEALATVERSEDLSSGVLARVSFFGDSHTAADLMTGRLRRRLQERFGDGGHGFVAAGRPWPSFRHRDVRTGASGQWTALEALTPSQAVAAGGGRLGLAGVAVEAERPGSAVWVATAEAGPVGTAARRFELHYLSQPDGGRFAVVVDGEQVARLSSRAAAPALSTFATEVADGPHELRVEVLGRGRVRLFGTVVERDGPGVVVDSLGLNGARVSALLAWDEEVFAQSLARRAPDLVVLWYGANSVGDDDSTSEQHQAVVLEAIARVRAAVPDAACLLVGPPDMARPRLSWRGPEGTPPALASIIAAQRDAAALAGCGFFDTFEAMGGEGSCLRWAALAPPLLAGDGVHFTAEGYAALADLLHEAIVDGYQRYLEAERQAATPADL
jgi:lysophospholipase L1-like esterase